MASRCMISAVSDVACRGTHSAGRRLWEANSPGFAVIPFHFGYTHSIVRIPGFLPTTLGHEMIRVRFPICDRLLVRPVRDRETESISVASALGSEETGLLGGQLQHACRHLAITVIGRRALRSENDGVVRR